MTTISYAITVCNEHDELKVLIDKLLPFITNKDELVVLVDDTNCTEDVQKLCNSYGNSIRVYYRPFNKDFAEHKNYLNFLCTKDWIFNIDADEYPTDTLLENLRLILEHNSDIDVIAVPRVNIVNGLTIDHISKWQWTVDSDGRVNWPDYQMRLYKNKPGIVWFGKVHEVIQGWKNGSHLPYDDDTLSLIHIKDITRQEKQNNLYNSL